MTTLAMSALGRRDRIWPAVLASAIVHVALAGVALGRRGPPELDAGQKPIVAKLVRLGEKRPEQLLPRKEAAPTPVKSAPTPVTVPTPSAKAVPVAVASRAKPPPAARPASDGKAGGDPLARVMSKLQQEKAGEAPRWGDPRGDRDGDASEAGEGDRYLALAQRALRENYTAPATIPMKDRIHLRAAVLILVEPNGAIREARISRSSGNDAFDGSVVRSARATRLPPPPAEFKDRYRRDGIIVEYTP